MANRNRWSQWTLVPVVLLTLVATGCAQSSDGAVPAVPAKEPTITSVGVPTAGPTDDPVPAASAAVENPTAAPATEQPAAPTAEAAAGFEPIRADQLNSGLPARWLGVTAKGELTQVDTADQQTLRSYGDLGDPGAPPPAEGSIAYIDAAWQLPGSDRIYVSHCCEPAGGSGYYIDNETELVDRMNSFVGYGAVPSPDATLIAVPQLFDLRVSEALPQAAGGVVSTESNAGRASVAWLRDRRGVVWAPNENRTWTLEVIELDDNNAPTASLNVPLTGLWSVSVAVRADGAIVVVGCDQAPEDLSRCDHSTALVLDPDSGEVISEFAIEPGARLGGYDYTGTYLIYTDNTGAARWQGAGESGVLGQGYTWASW